MGVFSLLTMFVFEIWLLGRFSNMRNSPKRRRSHLPTRQTHFWESFFLCWTANPTQPPCVSGIYQRGLVVARCIHPPDLFSDPSDPSMRPTIGLNPCPMGPSGFVKTNKKYWIIRGYRKVHDPYKNDINFMINQLNTSNLDYCKTLGVSTNQFLKFQNVTPVPSGVPCIQFWHV